jgi:hypothetical protein
MRIPAGTWAVLLSVALVWPAAAQDPGAAILDEAQATALSIPAGEFGDWARAVENVIRERAARGELDTAQALIALAPDPSILASLQIALVQGATIGGGSELGQRLALGIDDIETRGLALNQVIDQIPTETGLAQIRAAYALMPAESAGPRYVIDNVMRSWLMSGDEAGAAEFARSLTDPDQLGSALFWLADHHIDRQQLDPALAILAEMPPGHHRLLLQAALVGHLTRADRAAEGQALFAALPPDVQDRARVGLVRAVLPDLAAALAEVEMIRSETERTSALSEIAYVLGEAADLQAAQTLRAWVTNSRERRWVEQSLVAGLAAAGHEDLARTQIGQMAEPLEQDLGWLGLARGCLQQDETACALRVLPQVGSAGARQDILLLLIGAGADPDGALLAQALALARDRTAPKERAQALTRLVAALRQAEG